MDPAAWIGKTIDGRYAIEGVLGRGGMGLVLQAKHVFTGQPCALKVLHSELQLEPSIQQRFLAEAKAANAIGHRSIVQVLDAGRTPDGMLYIAMELLVGRTLGVALRRGELSPELAKRVMLDLLEALGHAHARGFVHRDLKPDNVFLCGRQNDVKLLDFGIAKVIDDVRKTATGALLGTPSYMAPEQLADASAVDGRADLWAIGVMVYEIMAGRLPMNARNASEQLVALASAEPTPIRAYLPNVAPEVEQFFARCLVRDPRQRFGDAAAMLQALAPLPFSGGAVPASTMATGHAPMGTAVATQGTVPPPIRHPISSPPPMSYAPSPVPAMVYAPPPTHEPAAVPVKGSKTLWIVTAGALGLIAIGIGIAVAVSGKQATQESRDASVGPKEQAPPDPTAQTCEEKCAVLDQKCSLRSSTCERDCGTEHVEAFRDCFTRLDRGCEDFAKCTYEKVCAKAPEGTASCRETVRCLEQSQCGTNTACLCSCINKLAPEQVLLLDRMTACLSRAVADGCTNQVCAQMRCAHSISACVEGQNTP